jgi:hypothetical protein
MGRASVSWRDTTPTGTIGDFAREPGAGLGDDCFEDADGAL